MVQKKRERKKFNSRSPRSSFQRRSRSARYEIPANTKIDFKNVSILAKFLTETGKIVSRRITGLNAKQQRNLSLAIKQARLLGLLPTGSRRK